MISMSNCKAKDNNPAGLTVQTIYDINAYTVDINYDLDTLRDITTTQYKCA